MTIQSLEKAVDDHEARNPGSYMLSFNCIPGLTVDELARRARLNHDDIRSTTVGRIRGAGFHITPTPGRRGQDGHCDVYLQVGDHICPSAIDLLALQMTLSEPISNPGKLVTP